MKVKELIMLLLMNCKMDDIVEIEAKPDECDDLGCSFVHTSPKYVYRLKLDDEVTNALIQCYDE